MREARCARPDCDRAVLEGSGVCDGGHGQDVARLDLKCQIAHRNGLIVRFVKTLNADQSSILLVAS